jgi:hypothetical protein
MIVSTLVAAADCCQFSDIVRLLLEWGVHVDRPAGMTCINSSDSRIAELKQLLSEVAG